MHTNKLGIFLQIFYMENNEILNMFLIDVASS